jgi:hypothetical protein
LVEIPDFSDFRGIGRCAPGDVIYAPGPIFAPGSDAGLGFGVAIPGGPESGPRDTLPEWPRRVTKRIG